jgi:drug/metabolite transporter (DMT)-like permease
MDKTIIAIILAIFLGIVGVAGDFFIKLAGSGLKTPVIKWFIIGSAIWASSAFGWYFVYKYMKLSTAGVFYAISTVLFLACISIFYFKEKLNIYEIIGIAAAIISLILLKRFS